MIDRDDPGIDLLNFSIASKSPCTKIFPSPAYSTETSPALKYTSEAAPFGWLSLYCPTSAYADSTATSPSLPVQLYDPRPIFRPTSTTTTAWTTQCFKYSVTNRHGMTAGRSKFHLMLENTPKNEDKNRWQVIAVEERVCFRQC